MKMLTKEDVKALTADQKLELMDLLSESLEEDHIPVSPEVKDKVESRLKTYHEDKITALPWRDALRRLTPGSLPFRHSMMWRKQETGTKSSNRD